MSNLLKSLVGARTKREPDQINEELRDISLEVAGALNEVLISFGAKSKTQFGQVVIMAGGAGSGKGFVLDNLVDIRGRVFDVDAMKKLAMKTPVLVARVKREYGVEMDKLDLRRPENVSKLHGIIDDLGLDKNLKAAFFQSVLAADSRRKPNLIFDVTLKDLRKLVTINEMVTALGYDPANIHIVWVLNDLNVALAQNAKRDRVVPEDILKDTHDMVSRAMANILKGKTQARKYMDGMFVIVPNQEKVDSALKKSDAATKKETDSSLISATVGKKGSKLSGYKQGSYLTAADYLVVKKRGGPFKSPKELGDDIIRKIRSYVPDPIDWIFESEEAEVSKTRTDAAVAIAQHTLSDLDSVLPNFERNYKDVRQRILKGRFQRSQMPVIRSKDYSSFQDWLEEQGVESKIGRTAVGELSPSQKQVFLNQVLDGILKNGLNKSLDWAANQSLFIVSKDGFIIDGHHRYVTGFLADRRLKVRTLKVDLNQDDLIRMALDFSDNVAGNTRNTGASQNVNTL